MKKIDLALWNSTLFTYSNWTEAVKYGIDKFYWLTDKSKKIQTSLIHLKFISKYKKLASILFKIQIIGFLR